MNMQEVYFKVRNHLLTQGRRAKIYDQCRYRAPNGDKCAIGCLIPDDKYDPSMEGHLISCSPLIQDAIGASEDHIDFLTDLQRVHDFSNPSEWNERLQAVALRYKLEPIQTSHKCAIGHLLPDGHPAQSHIFGVVNLYSNYPELFESNTDLDFLSRLQSAHDAPRLTNNLTGRAWVESFKKRLHLIAAEYKLTVPECGPVSCAKPECEAC